MMFKIVPPRPEFADAVFEYRNDEVTRQFNPLKPADLERVKALLSEASGDLSQLGNKGSFMWFVEVDGKVAGNFSLGDVNHDMQTASIGYGVFPWARGRGVAKWLVREMCQRIFADTPLRKLAAFVHVDNAASRKVLEASGFVCEGVLREEYLIDGKPVDEAVYGLLRQPTLVRELTKDGFLISDDPQRFDRSTIVHFLQSSYWAKGRTRDQIENGLRNSVCVGLYAGDLQIGFARAVTDRVTFAYLCDVFVLESHQRRGLGHALVQFLLDDPRLKNLNWILKTTFSHNLYRDFGFGPINDPQDWMRRPGIQVR